MCPTRIIPFSSPNDLDVTENTCRATAPAAASVNDAHLPTLLPRIFARARGVVGRHEMHSLTRSLMHIIMLTGSQSVIMGSRTMPAESWMQVPAARSIEAEIGNSHVEGIAKDFQFLCLSVCLSLSPPSLSFFLCSDKMAALFNGDCPY